jgi:hypothetical protein
MRRRRKHPRGARHNFWRRDLLFDGTPPKPVATSVRRSPADPTGLRCNAQCDYFV